MLRPNDGHRHAIFGMTGNGKTVFGLWCLSQRSYDRMPWIIIDPKRDDAIAKIPHIEEIDIARKPPKHRGIYVVRPDPADQADGTATQFLYDVWRRENIGLYIDEGYFFKPRDPALQAILTQGRSKNIPVIALSQRPSWISPFILSESEFKSVFFLQHQSDIDRVGEWLPARDGAGRRPDPYGLKPFHSYWHCILDREFRHFGPCPDEAATMQRFEDRMPRRVYF